MFPIDFGLCLCSVDCVFYAFGFLFVDVCLRLMLCCLCLVYVLDVLC